MTARQIAEAVGKDERSVQRWARKAADKMSSVAEKTSSAGHGTPANYTLDETIAIIEHGLGKNAAALFRENATHSARNFRHVLPAPATAPASVQLTTTNTPTAALLRELRTIYGTVEASKRIDYMIGYKPDALPLRFVSLFDVIYPVDHHAAGVILAMNPSRVRIHAETLGIMDRLDKLEIRDLIRIWYANLGRIYRADQIVTDEDVLDLGHNIDATRLAE